LGVWEAFTKEGNESDCGWCKDKYGMSWQVTPKRLMELNGSSDKEVATYSLQQMMTMKKIVIKDLEK
jgi:predicted 3-demethylubiquinone-9 3-methyltransferase (glyoxalase superfamily)